jgi:hypothetical protein
MSEWQESHIFQELLSEGAMVSRLLSGDISMPEQRMPEAPSPLFPECGAESQ